MRIARIFIFMMVLVGFELKASVPEHISYSKIYEFLDEMSAIGIIDINSAVKPYTKREISDYLVEIQSHKSNLNHRQLQELRFYFDAYRMEISGTSDRLNIHLLSPSISWRDSNFSALLKPIIGMQISSNSQGNQIRRWYGASIEADINNHWSIWGSLRDISHQGILFSKPRYLNLEPGYQYTVGTDYSDSRGGVSYENRIFQISFKKDQLVWGDNIHGSNILSGRAPSFPVLNFKLTPTKWFELNYFHGWLVSNVMDSSRYYLENGTTLHYRPANKFMAANLFTFTPIRNLKLSIGNSIVYAESSTVPAFFIPIAFYKSIDHSLTKGIATENQNSQLFLNFSSRNIKSLHLYSSIYIDEVQLARFSPNSDEKNPISYKVGAKYYNLLNSNLSLAAEWTRSNIINYKHSIPTLSWSSNSYNLGHYLGDNSQEKYIELQYKPFKTIDLKFSYTDAKKGNEFQYIRRGTYNDIYGKIDQIIAHPYMKDIIWRNRTIGLYGTYEISKDNYFVLNFEYNHAEAYEPLGEVMFGEDRMTATETLDLFTPTLLPGKNFTTKIGFSFGF